ncbi:3-phosphoshikimate 1-carboxyvinyltransferase [Hydrogenobacter hydrogenophilus]|uniref:3-phosphoshikimate 1-carboxyvinyltransferase n=1 Tax=Hydrogenobacter hydrogenophilus TaxID=35835 RepID=A0A285P3F5_9AQUI|nr:3-phosphoshikimate 1-carboxyvinyltransferase [Hydrogenobacter hydrogenophilus]SNZ15787.1 3-phosphoshikimate 1-carboxyvinyltransferase [Hydrogenobacter hydrogenophilus]
MLTLKKIKMVKGEIRVPSDKSISHRAILISSIAEGKSVIRNWLVSEDTKATFNAVLQLGVKAHMKGNEVIIEGRDYLFNEPSNILDAKNSGTTARLLMGVLSTQDFFSVITGDESLRNRPMLRVVEPLRQMGAWLDGREKGNKLPVAIRGGKLKGISFFNKRASAQVKSALLLASLKADGITEITEPYLSRDHTERMLRLFGAEITQLEGVDGHIVKIKGGQKLYGCEVYCPADPSSSAFFVALAVLIEGSELILKDVLVNPTRDGFFRKLKQMGAHIEYLNLREISGEPIADIWVKGKGRLRGINVGEEDIPSVIDELPLLALIMSLAEGTSSVRGAQELRVKESDRIKAVVENLRSMGAKIEEYEDGFYIEGVEKLRGAYIRTYKDHRIAMTFSIAGLVADGETIIDNPECVSVSYPDFFKDLERLTHQT